MPTVEGVSSEHEASTLQRPHRGSFYYRGRFWSVELNMYPRIRTEPDLSQLTSGAFVPTIQL